jgi:hypothetical protein
LAILIVAFRAPPVFAAILNVTVPEPVRVPPGSVIQPGTPLTLHVQPLPVFTDAVRSPPDAVTDSELGVTV